MKLLLFIVTGLLMLSCSPRDKKEITVLNKTFTTSIGIYFLEKDTISIERFNNNAKSIIPEFVFSDTLVESINQDSYYIKFIQNPSQDFPPPDTNYLAHSGKNLTVQEKIQLQNALGALSVTFFGTKENVNEKQKKISKLVDSISEGRSVIIADYNTIEFFNPNSWRSNRVNNFSGEHKDVISQISIHLYRENEFCRAVTLGMDKFCLPDISVKDISCRDQQSFGNLINAVVQTLFENQTIYEDSSLFIDLKKIKNDYVRNQLTTDLKVNAKKKAEINLKTVDPEEGDNINTQFLIVFKDTKFSSAQQEQYEILNNLFGMEESLTYTDHNSELLEASNKAKLRLPELKTRFNKGLEPGYSILLKAPFITDEGGREWMWVEITKWKNEFITGILQNEPLNIAKLKTGSIVQVNEEDIFDYMLYKPDGTSEGNETGKILEKRK